MIRVRRKPLVFEAVQWTGVNPNEIHAFMRNSDNLKYPKVIERRLRVKTLEGAVYADEGDWIIKGVNGEFWPVKPDVFEKTYEVLP